MRDAIRTLKDRLQGQPDTAEGTTAAVVPTDVAPADPKHVGTGGAWSVETRYPSPPPAAASDVPPPRLLSRAGQAVRVATRGSWETVVAVGLLVVALVLALRRSRRAA
jgi:hypothetical protein